MPAAVRFSCGDASAEEQAELEKELAALDGTEILEPGGGGGAAFAEVIVIAIITAGTPVVYDALKTFCTWLLARRSRGRHPATGPARVIIEGVTGSVTVTITPETKIEQLDLAGVGTITGIKEAK